MSDLKAIQVTKFDGKEFQLWKFPMEVYLGGNDLLDVVDGTLARTEADAPVFDTKEKKAKMYITMGLEYDQLRHIINCQNPNEMWKKL